MEKDGSQNGATSAPIGVPQRGFSLRNKIREMKLNLTSRDVDPAVFDVLSPFCGRGVEKPKPVKPETEKLHTVKEGVEQKHVKPLQDQNRTATPGYTYSAVDRMKEKLARDSSQQATVGFEAPQQPQMGANGAKQFPVRSSFERVKENPSWGYAGGLQQAVKGGVPPKSPQQGWSRNRLSEKDELRQELEANW